MGVAVSEPNFPNRTFAVMDNLPFLERLPDESVDLISIDPPFGKMETFRREAKPPITEEEKAEERDLFFKHGLSLDDRQHLMQLMVEGGSKVDDIFTWDDDISGNRSHKAFYDRIEAAEAGSMARRVHRVIEATRETAGDNQAAYICFMAVRLVHCYRVLKPTGSIYVHCDYKSDSHLRMLMDAIFGTRNFGNEIVWCYTGNSVPKKNFQAKHDTILFYAKSESSSFSLPKAPYSESTLRRYNHVDDDGRRYKMSSLRSGLEKVYAKDGKPMEDWWSDIPVVRGRRSTGYSTQKPLELARRIIEASSNPGDLVADLFAGCATTLVAAEVTGRRWLGCDWAYRAWTMNKRRFVSIPDGYGGPMRLTGTTEATLRALGLEGAQIPPLESFADLFDRGRGTGRGQREAPRSDVDWPLLEGRGEEGDARRVGRDLLGLRLGAEDARRRHAEPVLPAGGSLARALQGWRG